MCNCNKTNYAAVSVNIDLDENQRSAIFDRKDVNLLVTQQSAVGIQRELLKMMLASFWLQMQLEWTRPSAEGENHTMQAIRQVTALKINAKSKEIN